jgi:hypothetical protein
MKHVFGAAARSCSSKVSDQLVKEQQIVGLITKTIIKNMCNWENIEKRKRDEDYSAEKRPAYGVASQSRRRY